MLVGKIHYFVEGNTLLENIIVSKFKIASIFRKIVRIPQKMRQVAENPSIFVWKQEESLSLPVKIDL